MAAPISGGHELIAPSVIDVKAIILVENIYGVPIVILPSGFIWKN